MKMKKIDNRIETLRESAVYDYVAGHMNKDNLENFEILLAYDTQLQNMVHAERVFRERLLAFKRNGGDKQASVLNNSTVKL